MGSQPYLDGLEGVHVDVGTLAVRLYEIGAIRFGRFKLTSGLESPVYIDMRLVLSYPGIYMELVRSLANSLSRYEVSKVGGLETAGIPWASIVAYLLGKGTFYVRKAPKGHGTGRAVEGVIEPGEGVALVDDVVTTGSTLMGAVESVRALGARVSVVAVLVDRGQGGLERLRKMGIDALALVSLEQLLEALRGVGLVSELTYGEVINYLKSVRVID